MFKALHVQLSFAYILITWFPRSDYIIHDAQVGFENVSHTACCYDNKMYVSLPCNSCNAIIGVYTRVDETVSEIYRSNRIHNIFANEYYCHYLTHNEHCRLSQIILNWTFSVTRLRVECLQNRSPLKHTRNRKQLFWSTCASKPTISVCASVMRALK